MLKRLAYSIFFGNYFYGFCTVALAIEASFQQNFPPNSFNFYLLIFCGTVLFYTYAYIQEYPSATTNKRSNWYITNHKTIRFTQIVFSVACTILSLVLLIQNINAILATPPSYFILPGITFIVALAYYGIPVKKDLKINLRKTGWFKPFAIGFVWAVTVTYIPLFWHQVEQHTTYDISAINAWFFIKNFMYISLLAILFDIKDYAEDNNKKLKTFVVQVGLKKTIFYIIIPLTIIGFISFLFFASVMHFHALRIAINSIPFILLLVVAWSLQNRKSILYYLVVIDGLMLVKALCGITASLLVK